MPVKAKCIFSTTSPNQFSPCLEEGNISQFIDHQQMDSLGLFVKEGWEEPILVLAGTTPLNLKRFFQQPVNVLC
jgi:hypothetical protein